MKQHIDTIPVWEAYQADCECPLCRIRLKNEAMYVDNFLGASVMEPSTRVEVNQKGFCQRHFQMMFDSGNRLGLALLCHTYLKETMAKLDKDAQAAKEAAAGEAGKSIFARVGGKKAEGVQEILLPGERSARCARENQTKGINVPDPVYEELCALGKPYGLTL